MAINVCFSTSTGFFSRLIRWFTKSKVSHSLITFRDVCLDKVFVMEANGRGFMLTPWDRWRKTHQLVARFELSVHEDMQMDSLRKVAVHLGAEYDYVSLLGFVFRRFMKRMSNPMDDTGKLICSEAVAMFLRGAGLDGFDEVETFTPEDLYSIAQKEEVFVQKE